MLFIINFWEFATSFNNTKEMKAALQLMYQGKKQHILELSYFWN